MWAFVEFINQIKGCDTLLIVFNGESNNCEDRADSPRPRIMSQGCPIQRLFTICTAEGTAEEWPLRKRAPEYHALRIPPDRSKDDRPFSRP